MGKKMPKKQFYFEREENIQNKTKMILTLNFSYMQST